MLAAGWPAEADAQTRREPRPLGDVVRMRGAQPGDTAWALSESKNKTASINFLEKLNAPALECTYRNPAGKHPVHTLSFWANSRPDLSRMSGVMPVDVDVAVSACPASWGEAVSLGWGAGAWAAATAKEGVNAAEREAYAAQMAAKSKETPESRTQDWLASAAALPPGTDAEDIALARQIDADIGRLEANIASLHSRPFNDQLVGPGGLFERINRLGQRAYLKSRSLDPSPAGRARFDEWDERLGGQALSAIARLEKIVYTRQNRRVRMSEVTGDAGQSEMASWGNVDFSPVWGGQAALLQVFARHLDGRPLISPAFQQQVAKDLERTRPSGDPGRAYYYHVPAEPKPSWMLTPREQESQSGKLANNLFAAAVSVMDLMRLIDKVDADVRDARTAFWQCYATRCKQAGETFYAYSYAMWTKDNFYFAWRAMTPAMLGQGLSFLGEGAIDGGPISHCSAQANALKGALAQAVNKSPNDPATSARGVVAAMKGPVYLSWQGCRDRMEYILRPRFF